MRSVVAVGLLGALAGAVGLISLTFLPRLSAEDADSTDVAPDRRAGIAAAVEVGERLWHASCPVEEVDGACVELAPAATTRPGDLPTRCGDTSMRRWIVVPREANQKAAALALFDAAIDQLVVVAPTDPALRHDLGLARLYEGDALREVALAVAVPADLDFDPAAGREATRQRSRERLLAWSGVQRAARERAAAKYAEVRAMKDATTIVGAIARDAQLADDFVEQLYTLDIPSGARTGEHPEDRVDAFCDTIVETAESESDAVTSKYAACFDKATELGAFSAWSALCETALERLQPTAYPTLDELRRRPERDAPASLAPDADDYAIGLHDAGRGALVAALQHFEAAIADDPSAVMPWIDAGLVRLQFRSYDVAERLFARALKLAPGSYDALIGLGIARRGQRDLDGAEASYELARAADPSRGEAYYDLGILYKDFRTNAITDPDQAIALRRARDMYMRGRALFVQFLDKASRPADRVEAVTEIGWCDQDVKQIDTYLAAGLADAQPR